jgi:UDP-3-O-[3-hydroxymyristoyl] glucosamine N-acyltransferase
MRLTAKDIAKIVGGTIHGDENIVVDKASAVQQADETTLTFAANDTNLRRLSGCPAAIAIVDEENLEAACDIFHGVVVSVSCDVEQSFLHVAQSLHPPREPRKTGVSPAADVAASAMIGGETNIHPNATISEHVEIGIGCTIFPGAYLGRGVKLGDNVTLHPNVVLYDNVSVGDNCTIHANSVIGSAGFGYRQIDGQHVHIPHVGTVRVEANVEIGACTTIDRAKVGETVVGRGTKIDNLVMVAHNCEIGEHNLLAAHVALAGSATTGKYVVCAGQVGVADHVDIGDGAVFGAKSGVHRSMPGGETYLGAPAAPIHETRRQWMALRKLPDMRETLRDLEREVASLKQTLGTVNAANVDGQTKAA